MTYDPWSLKPMLTPVERVKASLEARCLKADMLLADIIKGPDTGAEIIVLHDWYRLDRPEGDGPWHRAVHIWAPLDKPARWFHNRDTPFHSRVEHVGRYRNFWIVEHADEVAVYSEPLRVVVWAGDTARNIDAAIERFVAMVQAARDDARAEAAKLSQLGRENGFAEKLVDASGSKERLLNIAAALVGTEDAAEAQRVASEYTGETPITGRLKKLKRMAQKHGVWREGLGL